MQVYYALITNREVSLTKELIWLKKTIVGPCVKYFWWQLLWDKLLVRYELVKQGYNVNDMCSLCGHIGETARLPDCKGSLKRILALAELNWICHPKFVVESNCRFLKNINF